MKKMFSLLFLSLILTACAQSSGGGGGSPSPTPPSGTASLSYSIDGHHFGLIPLNTTKSITVTVTNTGTKASNALNTSSVGGAFSVSSNTCSGNELDINESCSFVVNVSTASNGSLSTSINVSYSGGTTKNLTFAAKAVNFSATLNDTLVPTLLVNQNLDGSWNDAIGFDFGATLLALKSLTESKSKVNYSQNIWSGSVGLNLTLDYLLEVDDDGGGPNPVRDIDFSSDRDLVIDQWSRPLPVGGMKLKEILPSTPILIDQAINLRDSVNSAANSYIDDFLGSRRLVSGQRSMVAQYAYIMDRNRWDTMYGASYVTNNTNEVIEYQLRDIYVTLDSLIKSGKTSDAQELSKAILLNFLSTSDEIFDETGVRMKYSTTEFDHTSFTNSLIDEPLFTRVNTCRMNGYMILLVSLALKNADFTEMNSLLANNNLKSDLTNTVKNSWSTFKTVYLDNDDGTRTNCLPVATLAAFQAPIGTVTNSQINSLFTQLFSAADGNDYDPSGAGSVTALMEAIEAIQQTVNN